MENFDLDFSPKDKVKVPKAMVDKIMRYTASILIKDFELHFHLYRKAPTRQSYKIFQFPLSAWKRWSKDWALSPELNCKKYFVLKKEKELKDLIERNKLKIQNLVQPKRPQPPTPPPISPDKVQIPKYMLPDINKEYDD